jgi:L-lactate dehydrogenase complex protein LldF
MRRSDEAPTRPPLFTGTAALRAFARGRGAVSRLPLAEAWTRYRDLPTPQGETFQAQWARRQREPTP